MALVEPLILPADRVNDRAKMNAECVQIVGAQRRRNAG
jgi:hypothetical protein